MLTYFKKDSPVLYVFGQGTISHEKRKKFGLPLFQRATQKSIMSI